MNSIRFDSIRFDSVIYVILSVGHAAVNLVVSGPPKIDIMIKTSQLLYTQMIIKGTYYKKY